MLTIADLSPPALLQISWQNAPCCVLDSDSILGLGQSFIGEAVMGFFTLILNCLVRGAERNVDESEMDNSELSLVKSKLEVVLEQTARMRVMRKALLRKKLGFPPLNVATSEEAFDATKVTQHQSEANPKLLFLK